MKIKFIEVGRERKSWTSDLVEVNHEAMSRACRRALMSRDLEFVYDDEAEATGVIYAGVRSVGRFEISGNIDPPDSTSGCAPSESGQITPAVG